MDGQHADWHDVLDFASRHPANLAMDRGLGLPIATFRGGDVTGMHNKSTLHLVKTGETRQLSSRIFGVQAITLYERLIEDPVKVAIARDMAPAYVRFPGGMIGNYYNWHTGQLEYDVKPDSSPVYRFFAAAGGRIKAMNPGGSFIEPFAAFCKAINAENVLLVNLETSSAAAQGAWFRHMRDGNVLPRYIELGNEFWLAMMGDPHDGSFSPSELCLRFSEVLTLALVCARRAF